MTVFTERLWSVRIGLGGGLSTTVVALAVLLDESGSASDALTVAVSVICPDAVGVTTMVTMALAPFVSVPMEQLTGPVLLQEPCVVEEETNVTPAGSVSVRLTFVACAGPLLVTMILYEMFVPTVAGLGEAVLVNERSALVELVTRRETVAVCCRIPLVAVMGSGEVPTG